MNTIVDNVEALVDNMNISEDSIKDLEDDITIIESLVDNMDTIEGSIKDLYDKMNTNFTILILPSVLILFGLILLLIIFATGVYALIGEQYFLSGESPRFILNVEGIPERFVIVARLCLLGGLALITVGTIIILFMKFFMKNNKYLFMNIGK